MGIIIYRCIILSISTSSTVSLNPKLNEDILKILEKWHHLPLKVLGVLDTPSMVD